MAYLHQTALNDAIKRIHLLGSFDGQRLKQAGELGDEAGTSMGSFIPKRKIDHEKKLLERKTPGAEGAIKAYAREREAAYPDPEGAMAAELQEKAKTQDQSMFYGNLDHLPQQLHNQEVAENTAFGGKYTPQGLESTMKTADANGNDRLRMRAMIRATANPGPQYSLNPGMGGSEIPGGRF